MQKIDNDELIKEMQRRFDYNGKARLKDAGPIYPFSYPNLLIGECVQISIEGDRPNYIFSAKCPIDEVLREEIGNLLRETLNSRYSWPLSDVANILRIAD